MLQTACLLAVIVACLWAVTSPHIHTGIFITTGLVLMACGCIAELDWATWSERAERVRLIGAGLMLWGIFWRVALRPLWLALSMRWNKAHVFARLWGVERRVERRE